MLRNAQKRTAVKWNYETDMSEMLRNTQKRTAAAVEWNYETDMSERNEEQKRKFEVTYVLSDKMNCKIGFINSAAKYEAVGLVHQWSSEKTVSKPHCSVHFLS